MEGDLSARFGGGGGGGGKLRPRCGFVGGGGCGGGGCFWVGCGGGGGKEGELTLQLQIR